MREIKFRGFSQEKEKWVYGCGTFGLGINNEAYIVISDEKGLRCVEIENPNTIGQFTGLKDKRGAEIYENDILKLPSGKITAVSFMFGLFCYDEDFTTDLCNINANSEIIGNTYENANLLDK